MQEYPPYEQQLVTITYVTEPGLIYKTELVPFGMPVNPDSVTPTRDGYVFAGWYMDAQFREPASNSLFATHPITFYAKWTTPLPSYQVGFVLEDGGEINYQTYKEGSIIDLDSYIPERENKKFTGWYYDEDHTLPATGTITVTGPIYLYSSWTNDFKKIPITLVYNNGTPNKIQEVNKNYTVKYTYYRPAGSTAPEGKQKAGAWYLDEAMTIPFIEDIIATEPFTLYYFWADTPVTITYHNKDNNPDTTKTATGYIGVPLSISASSNYGEADGYIFEGWYTDEDLTKKVESTIIIPDTETINLYAKWSDDICTITTHTNNDNGTINTKNVAAGTTFSSVSLKSAGTKNFHDFERYYFDEECTIPVPDDYIIQSNIDIYGGWTRRSMTLKFKLNNGLPMIGIEVQEGIPINLYETVDNPEKEGYVFAGWYEDSACTKPIEDPENYTPRSAYSTVYAYFDDTWRALADTSWYTDSSSELHISTPEELAGLAKIISQGNNNFEGKTIVLQESINLDGYKWAPIGEGNFNKIDDFDNPYEFDESNFYVFKGTFDGNNKTISNIHIDKGQNNGSFDARKSYLGLFGVIGNGATIRNLTIENIDIKGDSFIGGLVGYVTSNTTDGNNETVIKGITIQGDISISGGAGLGSAVGRVEAKNTAIKMENINVNANPGSTIKSGYDAGYSASYAYIGGIIGVAYSSNSNTMTNCSVNNLNLEAVFSSVGGLAGGFGMGSISDSSVSNMNITLIPYASGNIEEKSIGAFVGTPVGSGNIEFSNTTATRIELKSGALEGELYHRGYVGAQEAIGDITDRISGLPDSASGIIVSSN